MKSQFSEFTYGYTLVEELSRTFGFRSVPTFPSLIDEGRDGGGYDVGLNIDGLPFFLQFKRTDFLSRANASHYTTFRGSYYRFNLHAQRHSKQHELLLHLENSGNPVFYVAPKFHKSVELHDNYFNSSISINSIWIQPSSIGKLPDDDEHSICFNKSESHVYFCSEPRPIYREMRFKRDSVSEYVKQFKSRAGYSRYHKETWSEIYNQLEYICRMHDPAVYNKLSRFLASENNFIVKTAKLSRLAFGADMLLYRY
ncbi:hypothetical protein F3J34_23390 [Klebsiella sp. Ap-873]|uniref:hypothetical protein n=1 Tax=Cedecea neteri TaxID=158822 RepID=UPI0012E04CDF|nr:hypothetical protein [Cedecea neteri]NIG76519.1 hypothetical protein [Klebsiella sp. Ap-873]